MNAGTCSHGRALGGHLVHTSSESRTPSRIIRGLNKSQMKLLLIMRGYAKQKAFIMSDKL